MNSLRSNSISYFVAQIADAIRDSISIQRICIPLKTSSCGMFFNSPYIPHPQYYFSASIPYTKRRPATRSRRDHGSPRRGTGFASHTKTFMERVFPRNKLKASCQDGERFGEWFETPSYEEGARGWWRFAGLCPALMRSLDYARDDKVGEWLKDNCSAMGLESYFCLAGLIAF